MRVILISIFLVGFHALSQDLVMVKKVTADGVLIKWLPNNFSQLVLLSKGATISRAISDQPTNFQLVNFTNAKQWTIEPTLQRANALDTTQEHQKFKLLLEPILDNAADKEQQGFAMLTTTIENMVNPRFQFVLGNALLDSEADKTTSYVYKVEIKGIPTSYIFVDASQKTSYSAIPEFSLALDAKKTVMIEWNSNAVQKEALGFLVEHSMDTQKEGAYLSKLPHIPFKTQFELADKKANINDDALEGHWHFYRVHGLDPFGAPSLVSEWKSIYVPLLIQAHVQVDTVFAKSTERIVNVSATLLKKNANIQTWSLLRSEQKDTGFEQVASKPYTDSMATFSVASAPSGDAFYYKICAINKDDTVSSLPYYFFTLDQERPDAPTALSGAVDSSGIVRLAWIASPDLDIKGYRVWRGNAMREEFIERTTSLSTKLAFVDTIALDNLTSEIYYFVSAVDLNYNNSISSDTVLLLKPDTIAPMAAALKSVSIQDSVLVIAWANSDSEDLAKTTLLRNGVELAVLSKNQSSFTDSEVQMGQQYTYQLICEDKSANQSRSQEVGQYFETGYRLALRGCVAKVNREEKRVEISWEAPKEAVFSYQLFRSKNGSKLSYLATLSDPNQLQYTDKQLAIGNKYTYSIKYVTADGIHSLPATMEIIY